MKKYLLAIAFLITIPSITFASWWNPFSWRIFSASVQTNPPIQTTNTATSSNEVVARPTLTPSSSTTSTTSASKPASKVSSSSPKPVATLSASTQVKQSTQPKVIEKSSQPVKVSTPTTQAQIAGTLCNGTYWGQCPTGQNFICPQNGNAYCQLPQQPALQPQITQQKQTTSRRPISTPANQVQNIATQQTNQNTIQSNGSAATNNTLPVTSVTNPAETASKIGKVAIANNLNTPSGQVTVDASGKYTVQAVDISGQYQDLQLQSLIAHVTTSGTGTITGACLYKGSTVYCGGVANGVATFNDINIGIPQNTTITLNLKLDVTGVSPASPLSITSSFNGSDINTMDSQYSTAIGSGSAVGNSITVVSQ